MTDSPESYSIPEIVRLLKGVSSDVQDLRGEVRGFGQAFVTRAELAAWQTAYDSEVRDLKETTKPVKVSGWVIAGFGLSVVVGIGSLLGIAITLINFVK